MQREFAGGARFFETPVYPHQFATRFGEPSDYLGELRGFYPNTDRARPAEWRVRNGYFQPYNSMKHAESVSTETELHRRHSGVDVYTGYQPFPHEVPVYALASGTALVRTRDTHLTRGAYQSLGNRIRLSFTVPLGDDILRCAFDYGHLSRFAPGLQPKVAGRRDVRVKAGQLIGFSGKSGNADTAGESTTRVSPFGVDACHIHLGFLLADRHEDPLAVLPLPLTLRPEQRLLDLAEGQSESATRLMASEWDPPPALRETQSDIAIPRGRLVPVWNSPLARVRNARGQSRARLPDPFGALDFDHTASLIDTRTAFEALVEMPEPAAGAGAHAEVCADLGLAPEANRWLETVGALSHRASLRAGTLVIAQPPIAQDTNAALAMLAIMHLLEAGWMLLGGAAFAEATKGRRQPACGFGLYGDVRAVALDHAVAAIHRSAMPLGKDGSTEILSLTFGSGSLRHAVLSGKAVDQAEATIAPYLRGLRPVLAGMAGAFDFAFRRFRRLEFGHEPSVAAFQQRIDRTAQAARGLAERAAGWDRDAFVAFGQLMGRENAAALAWAEERSRRPEAPDGRVFSPAFKGLALRPARNGEER